MFVSRLMAAAVTAALLGGCATTTPTKPAAPTASAATAPAATVPPGANSQAQAPGAGSSSPPQPDASGLRPFADIIRDAKELRVKESDRIDAMAKGLRAAGITVEEGPDWWIVHGRGFGNVPGGVTVETRLDHRIAMSFLVMGLATTRPVTVDDASPIVTSFPVFGSLMTGLGAEIGPA